MLVLVLLLVLPAINNGRRRRRHNRRRHCTVTAARVRWRPTQPLRLRGPTDGASGSGATATIGLRLRVRRCGRVNKAAIAQRRFKKRLRR